MVFMKCFIRPKEPESWDQCRAPTDRGFIELTKTKPDTPQESCCFTMYDNVDSKVEKECFWTASQMFKEIENRYELGQWDFYR
jgi:hypothetical protein